MAGVGYTSPHNRYSSYMNDPFKGLNQNVSGQGQNAGISNRLEGFDPRDIMQGDAFKRLMQMSGQGTGALNQANQTMAPAIAYMKQMLGNSSPLGQGRGDVVRSAGTGAIDSALEGTVRQSNEASTRYGRASDPEAAAFSQGMVRSRAAGGYGSVEREAQMTELTEKQMNESFRAGIANSLNSAGISQGGLAISDFNSRANAASQALQSESFARNTAGELLTRILGYGSGGGGALGGFSLEDQGRLRENQRQMAFGHIPNEWGGMSPFGAYGSQGGVASDLGATGGYNSRNNAGQYLQALTAYRRTGRFPDGSLDPNWRG